MPRRSTLSAMLGVVLALVDQLVESAADGAGFAAPGPMSSSCVGGVPGPSEQLPRISPACSARLAGCGVVVGGFALPAGACEAGTRSREASIRPL